MKELIHATRLAQAWHLLSTEEMLAVTADTAMNAAISTLTSSPWMELLLVRPPKHSASPPCLVGTSFRPRAGLRLPGSEQGDAEMAVGQEHPWLGPSPATHCWVHLGK